MTQGPLILAVETSSRIGSVALARGHSLIEESAFSAPLQHSGEILPAIDGLLRRHGHAPGDIDQVHIPIGPGSFTGLRIAVTVAKTMHLACGVQIVTVDALDVVAASLHDVLPPGAEGGGVPGRIAALFDAKRGQFFVAVYERAEPGQHETADPGYQVPAPGDAAWHKTLPDCLMTAGEIMDRFARDGLLGVLGDGLVYHRERFLAQGAVVLPEPYWGPRAGNVHRLGFQKAAKGLFANPLTLTPLYLRGPQVTLRQKP